MHDVTGNNMPTGRVFGKVHQAPGPDGLPGGSYKFPGERSNFIFIPNRKKLDAPSSITISMWVKPRSAGPLFHYKPRGWGVHVWMTKPNELFARFVSINDRQPIKYIKSKQVKK